MKEKYQIGNDIFTYSNEGGYINIFGYDNVNGKITFDNESEDGKYYYDIIFPESIDGLPVLKIDNIYLSMDCDGPGANTYRHNGNTIIRLHIPVGTSFEGLPQHRKDQYSVYVPYYKEEYYVRDKKLLCGVHNGFIFHIMERNDHECDIIAIVTEDTAVSKDWVWESRKGKENLRRLEIPDVIEGHTVLGIKEKATKTLSKNISSIYFGESLEEIGNCCFTQLPYLTKVHFGTSIKKIGEGCFSFYESEEFLTKVPAMTVQFFESTPEYPSSAFKRYADKEEYEEYSDWGNMYCGCRRVNYKVDIKCSRTFAF